MNEPSKNKFKKPPEQIKHELREIIIMFVGTILLATPAVIIHNVWYTNNAVCNITQPDPLDYTGNITTYVELPMNEIPKELEGFTIEPWRAEIRWPKLQIGDDLSRQEVNIVCWRQKSDN